METLVEKIGQLQLEMVISRYTEVREDGLCHEGAWEITHQKVAHLALTLVELEVLENWLRSEQF